MQLQLSSRTEGFSSVSLSLVEGPESANYDTLERQLGLDFKKRAVVLDGEGAAVLLTTEGARNASSFVVLTRSDLELEVAKPIHEGVALPNGSDELKAEYRNSRQQNAALNAVLKATKTEEHLLFPDYNQAIRDAYNSGIRAQMPTDFMASSSNSDRIAGLPHEPTIAEVENFKTSQLRWAYTKGLVNADKKAAYLPSSFELREAHRKGKEAVCICLSSAEWGRVDIETFKMCSVPTEYAFYEGGVDKSEADHLDRREILRNHFFAGVEDAWKARQANCVTQVKSSDRVSEDPTVQQAFELGVEAAKRLQSAVPGAVYVVDNNRVSLSGESDPKYDAQRTAFQNGLDAKWQANEGVAPARGDQKYPDVSTEPLEAYRAGVVQRRKNEKEEAEIRDARARAEEEEKKLQNKETFVQKLTKPCVAAKRACCPLTTEDPEGNTLLCGTSLGDWTLILLAFLVYYCYLGMWMWAFIEVLQVTVEPQRPH